MDAHAILLRHAIVAEAIGGSARAVTCRKTRGLADRQTIRLRTIYWLVAVLRTRLPSNFTVWRSIPRSSAMSNPLCKSM
jgi:hypothetical protein